jgi:hypothetical protein
MSRHNFGTFSPLANDVDTDRVDNNEDDDDEDIAVVEVLSGGGRGSLGACKKLKLFLNDQFLVIAIVAAIGLALAAPSVGRTGGVIYSQITISYGATVCIFLISGLSLKTSELAKASMSVGFNCYTQFFIFLVIPAITYPVVLLLRRSSISSALLDGLMITVWLCLS